MSKLAVVLAALAAAFAVATPAMAETTVPYQATYVEPVGGPVQSPFSCTPGTSCGSASISGIGSARSRGLPAQTQVQPAPRGPALPTRLIATIESERWARAVVMSTSAARPSRLDVPRG
jgi:hypothetical protein